MEADGRFVLQSGGRCRYARVRVRYLNEPPAGPDEPRAELAAGLREEGGWFAGWREAALLGAALFLESTGAPGRCIVIQINDRDVPPSVTTPRTIAVAAVRAAWAAVGFAPDEETAKRVEARAAGQAEPYW